MGLTKERIQFSELGIGMISSIIPVLILGLVKKIWVAPVSILNTELCAAIVLIGIGLIWLKKSHWKLLTEFNKHLTKWGIAFFAAGSPFFMFWLVNIFKILFNFHDFLNDSTSFAIKFDVTNLIAGFVTLLIAVFLVLIDTKSDDNKK